MFLDENDETPFNALRYTTGECNYGGRVTDDKDRTLLNTLLARYFHPDTVAIEKHALSDSGRYFVPEEGPRDNYLEVIENLPLVSAPEVFGLHENADITKDVNETNAMLTSLLACGGSSSGGGGGDGGDDRVRGVVRDCLRQLPPNFDIEATQAKYPVRYEESMNTVLVQEMVRYNRLLSVMRDSLENLKLALAGLQVMSGDLDTTCKSMAVSGVPTMWAKVSYPSLKPLASYLEDLYQRLAMLKTWADKGPPPVFWMSGFFFVHSFLTAGL